MIGYSRGGRRGATTASATSGGGSTTWPPRGASSMRPCIAWCIATSARATTRRSSPTCATRLRRQRPADGDQLEAARAQRRDQLADGLDGGLAAIARLVHQDDAAT